LSYEELVISISFQELGDLVGVDGAHHQDWRRDAPPSQVQGLLEIGHAQIVRAGR